MKLTPAQQKFLAAVANREAYRNASPPYEYFVKSERRNTPKRVVAALRDLGLVVPDHDHRTALVVPLELTTKGQAVYHDLNTKQNAPAVLAAAILTPDALTLTADQLETALRIWDTHPGSGREPSTAMCQLYAISEGGTLDQAAAALHTARNTTR